jgi:hypothetical protein
MSNSNDDFYSDDVQAEAVAANDQNEETLNIKEEDPVTSGEMNIGDLDDDSEVKTGSASSYDEESVPAGDNAVSDDSPMD